MTDVDEYYWSLSPSTNSTDGIHLNNEAGTGNIVVSGGYANHNHNYGYLIYTNGTVTMSGFTANTNGVDGLYIDNTTGAGKSVTLTNGTSNTSKNSLGVEIYTKGAVTLTSITADSNQLGGVSIDNSSAGVPLAVTVTTGEFNGNVDGAGLSVVTLGAVSLNNITASSNSGSLAGHGVDIDNCRFHLSACVGTGTVSIGGSSNSFNSNESDGLFISSGGAITLINVQANGNGNDGAVLHNDLSIAVQPVTISSSSFNSTTTNDGLTVHTKGNIALTDVSASDNGVVGISLDNRSGTTGTITVTTTSVTLDGNGTDGLEAYSNGAIKLTGKWLDASHNVGGNGILLDNHSGTAGVTVTGSLDTVSQNYTYQFNVNGLDGLSIISKGPVAVSDIIASQNVDNGLEIGSISVSAYPSSVTCSNLVLNDNGAGTPYNGAVINAAGPVTLTNILADGNGHKGMEIDNTHSTTAQPVAISSSSFNNTTDTEGLDVYAKGNITLTDVSASGNTGAGIFLDNRAGTGTITINTNNVTLDYNLEGGLWAYSNGAIKLSGKWLYATGNTGCGIILDNQWGTAGVTVSGSLDTVSQNYTYQFNGNSQDGLDIISRGAVVFSDILASQNITNDGIEIGDSTGGIYPSSVTGSNLQLNDNGIRGAAIFAAGPVTLTNVLADGCGDNGLHIDNTYSSTSALVSVKQGSLNGNSTIGLEIFSHGNVTIDSIRANSNSKGLYIDTTGAITLLGTLYTNQFNNSTGSEGFSIHADGNITLNNFTANNNETYGSVIGSGGKVTITGATVMNNLSIGILASANNAASFSSVVSSNNGTGANDDGLLLDINSGTVSFTKSYFMGNKGSGIEIVYSATKPVVTFTSTFYTGNDTDHSGNANYTIHT